MNVNEIETALRLIVEKLSNVELENALLRAKLAHLKQEKNDETVE